MRAVLAYCAPLGIPYTRFLGRVGPPAWTEDDQDYALAWQAERARVCKCGSRAEDWPVDEAGRLLPDPPLDVHDDVCVGCEILEDHAQTVADANGGRLPHGYRQWLGPYVEVDE